LAEEQAVGGKGPRPFILSFPSSKALLIRLPNVGVMVFELLFNAGLLIAGAAFLLKGADWVTDSAAHVAERFHTTSVAVGLILVSIMLSLPELIVAGSAVLKDHPQIGLGTILGSVIINVGLVVAFAA